ncbi:MAG: histidinol phosphatase [Flavobacterium sp. MedPE-SWcel]|uniref:tyrosine-protein phosphatase n=1 Tax=uncultured Flavobacterium sp. TaxID=165435 RepID=UPI000916611F|nr:CpsB/CapC family capsule biosynthesis tyrosine phosphatase [uncultured Flavobacterium sp.]OIQ21452.1 MAG: histidinol phosphatase [Flavobacterium sp. MedPE-SWcel]
MLFFKKPKTRLVDLIPDGYIDIHSHLLPNIDDGAKDNEDSQLLINSLKDYGFSEFITTPHVLTGVWNNTRTDIETREKETINSLDINVPFKAAAEYLMDDTFQSLFKSEQLLTLKNNYVLVEMSYLNPPMQLYDILFELQIAGYKPILAHPERYTFYLNNMEEYKKLKKAGCSFQMNLLSVTGYYGKAVLEISKKLLESDMIDYVGSDAHHMKHVNSFKNPVVIKNHKNLEKALNNNSQFKI